jgi:hypothetical protein
VDFEAIFAHFQPILAARAPVLTKFVSIKHFPAISNDARDYFFRLAFLITKIEGATT